MIKNFSDNKLRPKAGKTTLLYNIVKEKFDGDVSKLLLGGFEKGYNALNGIHAVDIEDWEAFQDLVDELVENKDSIPYRIFGMDTVDMAEKMVVKYVLNKLSISDGKQYKTLQDVGYGKAHNMVESEFIEQITKLDKAGFSLFYITHDKDKTVKTRDGQEYDKTTLSLTGKIRDVVLNSVDFIVFIDIAREKVGKEMVDKRYIHFRSNGDLEAGSRFPNIADKIEYSASGFIEEVESAILNQYGGDAKAMEEAKKEQVKEKEEKASEYIEEQKNSVDKFDTAEDLINLLKDKIGNFSEDKAKMDEIKKVIKQHNNKKIDYTKMTDVDALKAIAEFVNGLE
jgi:AAA domain